MDSFFTDGVSSISLSGKLSDTSSNGNQQQFTDQTTASTTTTIATQRSKRAVSMSSNVLADGIAASRKSISSDFVRQEFRTGYYGGARFTGPSLDIPRSRFADLDMEEDEDDDGGDVVAPMGNGKVKFMSKVSSKASGGSGGETASSVWTKRLRNRIRMSCDVSTWEREKFVKPLSSGVIVVPPGGGARSTTTLSSSPAKTMSFSMKSLFLNHPRGMAAEESSVSSSSGLAKRTSTPVFSSSKKKFGSEVHGVYEDDGSSSSKKIHSKSGITAESGNCIVS